MAVPDLLRPLPESDFAAVAQALVSETAPRLFALFAELGEREDGEVAAWGLAFDDEALVLPVGGGRTLMVFGTAEQAHRRLSRLGRLRLIWSHPAG